MQVKSNTESVILSTFIKLSFVIKIFVLSIFEWPFYTGFTVVRAPLKEHARFKSILNMIKNKLA